MNIYEKILAVMQDVEYLQKDGNVSFGKTNYNYLSEEKITGSIRTSLIKNRLIMFPVNCEQVQSESTFDEIIMTYRIVDVDDLKSFIDVQTKGCGHDSGDKKSYKAMTGAFKYAQRQTFMISTGDDPDHNSSEKTKEDIKKSNKKAETQISAIDKSFYEECKHLATKDRDKYDKTLNAFEKGKYTSAKGIPVSDRDHFLEMFESSVEDELGF